MDLGSPNKNLEEMNDLNNDDDSSSVGKLDLNLAVSKEGSETWGDKTQVNRNQQDQGSLLLPSDVRSERPESPYIRPSSPAQFELDHDQERRKNFDYSGERLRSPPDETLAISGGCSDKSSSPVQAETFHTELEIEDPACFSLKSPSTEEFTYQQEDLEKANSPHDELKKISGHFSGNSQNVQSLSDNGQLEDKNGDPHSPGRTPKRSASPVRQMSVSPERAPDIQEFAGQKLSPERSSRQKHSLSPERPGGDSKKVVSQDHLSHSARRSSTSPGRRSRKDSPHRSDSVRKRRSTSPRRRHLPPDLRRQDGSVSQSTRQKDSYSGHGKDYRDRSRSRSPNARDYYRRSPRRRYSPRHRSPPSGYHSRRRSPRRRPWSPPPNRSTGIGRPGNNLFVAGFSFLTTERDLERKFSRFGRVRDVRIVRDKRSGDSRGFGFLSLERDEDADAAIRALDQTEWNGRVVLVEKSKSR